MAEDKKATTLEVGVAPLKVVIPITESGKKGFLARVRFLFTGKLQLEHQVRFAALAVGEVGGKEGGETERIVRSCVEATFEILGKVATVDRLKDRAQVKGNVFRFESSAGKDGVVGRLLPVKGAQFQMPKKGGSTTWNLGEECSACKAFVSRMTDFADQEALKAYASRLVDHDARTSPDLRWLISVPIMHGDMSIGVLCVHGVAGDFDEATLKAMLSPTLNEASTRISEVWAPLVSNLVFIGEKHA